MRYDRALAYAQMGQWARALEDYAVAIDDDSLNASAYNNRGFAYSSLCEHQLVVDDYTRCIALDWEEVLLYNNRGNALKALGRVREAERDFARPRELEA